MRLKDEILLIKNKIELLYCFKKFEKFLKFGVPPENTFLGNLFLLTKEECTEGKYKRKFEYYTPAVFVKLLKTKKGDYYYYLHEDENMCMIVNTNPSHPINNKASLKIVSQANNFKQFYNENGNIDLKYIAYLNSAMEEKSIFDYDKKQK